jgi:ribonuclease HII
MAVLVGIDEAGFGPILGPLVVSSSTFSLPRRLIKADLWQILRVANSPKKRQQQKKTPSRPTAYHRQQKSL